MSCVATPMILRRVFSSVFAAVAALTVAVPSAGQAVEGIAAIVNDDPISTFDVQQRMRLILSTSGVQPDEELLRRIQAQALNSLIEEQIQLQEAERFEVEVSEAEINDALADLARQNNISVDSISSNLARAGIDVTTLEDQLRAEIAWRILVNGRYGSRVRVSDDQIDEALRRISESSSKPQYLLSEIVLEIPLQATDEQADQLINTVFTQLSQGAPFPAIARQYSASPTGANGGDLGWVRAGEMRTEIEAAVAEMQVGQVAPIQTANGVTILALRDRRAAADPTKVTLKQVLLPVAADAGASAAAAAVQSLRDITSRIQGCDSVDAATAGLDGVLTADLPGVSPGDLAPAFRDAIAPLDIGEASEPIQSPAGALLIVLCGRERDSAAGAPSRQQVEDNLLNQQLVQLSRRYLRDLRREATIETRAR